MGRTSRLGRYQFNLPKAVIDKAHSQTKDNLLISVTPNELIELMSRADGALNGDANDREHDDLYFIREWISMAFEDPNRRIRQ